jgi:hypothetical protein
MFRHCHRRRVVRLHGHCAAAVGIAEVLFVVFAVMAVASFLYGILSKGWISPPYHAHANSGVPMFASKTSEVRNDIVDQSDASTDQSHPLCPESGE